MAGALLGNLVQGGLRGAVRPIVPDLSRAVLRWGRFHRRAFSVEAAGNLIKALLKVVIIGATAVFTVGTALEALAGASVAAAGAVLARAALRGGSLTASRCWRLPCSTTCSGSIGNGSGCACRRARYATTTPAGG